MLALPNRAYHYVVRALTVLAVTATLSVSAPVVSPHLSGGEAFAVAPVDAVTTTPVLDPAKVGALDVSAADHNFVVNRTVTRPASQTGAVVLKPVAAVAPVAAMKPTGSRGEKVVRVAAAQAGDPYVYGATGPNAFDCSGLTSFVYRVAVGKTIPRTSSAQRAATKKIRARDAQRGDLVFFHNSGGVYHVGIYAGKHQIWHAPSTGSRVHKARIWTSAVSYGRVR